jgi:hypothetical protein
MASGFVYVIESPSDSDLLDGRTEGRSLCEALRLAEIPHWYSLVTTSATFTESIGHRLLDALTRFNEPPIIHLSMHGNNEGVALTIGEFLSWDNLRTSLAPLTNAMNGGLLICMSSCFGSSGCRMAMHEETDQPFWALVGNSGSAQWADAGVAYITFYHLFFKDIPVEECVKRMQLASGDGNFIVFTGQAVKEVWAAHISKVRREQLAEAVRTYSAKNQSGGLNAFFTHQP